MKFEYGRHGRRSMAWVSLTSLAIALSSFGNAAIQTVARAESIYRVEVQSAAPDILALVQTQVPDAYILTKADGSRAIAAGTFTAETNARQQATQLRAVGAAPATVVPFELETSPNAPASQPTAAANPASSARTYAALVRVPAEAVPATTLERVRQFFPQSELLTYNGQSAIRTGTFSQVSQAKLQTDWLKEQEFDAIAVPLATLNRDDLNPAAAAPDAPAHWVLVADPVGANFRPIRSLIPAAQATLYNQQQVVRAGVHTSREQASAQVQFLASQGYEAGIFPATVPASSAQTAIAPANELSTTPSTSEAPAQTDSESIYWVYVPTASSGDTLVRVREIAADAFVRQWQGRSVVQVGSYFERPSAELALQKLSQMGLAGEIVQEG
ncbi:hypothetical protein [Synechococcus sp. PCC 7336]|uniref:hypothetical protein n=1 Tax=Synechococcus sp. PCC 7336 TaxID=195250 RepID=UPI000348430F|nr:hypothetical protein [Synechococcus sp. PCC 7336]